MKYDSILKDSEQVMIEELMRFVSINSAYDEKTITKEHPFGAGVADALEYVAKLGLANGFSVEKCDGYCTELTIGEGKRLVSLFAHADVVPATGVWKNPPYSPYVENGRLYGRGTSDDKGPFMAAFFAIIALRKSGLLKNYRVRLVVGGDEERGAHCLEYYFKNLKKEQPDYGFTPDADFPLIYGEKGINDFFPELKIDIPHVISMNGGVATNAVCDRVAIKLDDPTDLLNYCKEKTVAHRLTGENEVTIYGKSAHGSTPELGVNAALKTMQILGELYGVKKLVEMSEALNDTSGKSFGGYCETKLMGPTTYCVGKISYENGTLKFSVNFRYPETVYSVEYKDKFDAFFGTTSTMGKESHYLLFDPKTKLVKTLLKAYRKETHDFTKPLVIGGGTYAKYCKNTIAFGALFPGREYVMHQTDEYMPVEDIIKASRIYARAIYYLGKLR